MVTISGSTTARAVILAVLSLAWGQYAPLAAAPSAEPPPAVQTAPGPGATAVPAKLSLKECLQLALQHNAGYKQSLVSVANAEWRLRSANQLRHTAIDSDISFSRNSEDGYRSLTSFGPTLALSQPSGAGLTGNVAVPGYSSPRIGGQAGLEYTLPLLRGRGRGSETRAQLVQARIDSDRTRLTHFDSEQELLQSVAQAYFDAIRAQDLLRIQEQAVQIADQVTKDTQKRLDEGLIVEIDLTRAQLQLSSTREQLLRQQQSYRNSIDTLVLLLGLPVGAQPELTDTISYTPTPIDEATAIRTALERRPELQQLQLQQADSEVQLALAGTRRKPRADMRFNLSSLGFSLFGGGGITNVLTSLLGLRVSVPVKERALRENIAQAERNRAILDDEYEFRRQFIVNDVRRLVRSAETAKSNIDLLTQNLEVAKKSQHIAQRRFEEGLADNRDLLDAQASITSTEGGVLAAKVDYFLTMINLQRAMGQPLRPYFNLPEAPDPAREALALVRYRPRRPTPTADREADARAKVSGATRS